MDEQEIVDLIDRHVDAVGSDIKETIREMRDADRDRPRLLKEIYALKHRRKALGELKEDIQDDDG